MLPNIERTGPSPDPGGRDMETADSTSPELLARVEALEAKVSSDVERPTPVVSLATLEAYIPALARTMKQAADASEPIARAWMAVPGAIGVFIVGMGLTVLLASFLWVDNTQFHSTVWGGIALITVGTLSATVSAVVAKPPAAPRADQKPMLPSDV